MPCAQSAYVEGRVRAGLGPAQPSCPVELKISVGLSVIISEKGWWIIDGSWVKSECLDSGEENHLDVSFSTSLSPCWQNAKRVVSSIHAPCNMQMLVQLLK